MSKAAYLWAKSQTGFTQAEEFVRFSSAEKFVLMMIGDHFNAQWHRAWPGHATLAQETGLSVPTVKRSIKSLEAAGLVNVEPWVLNDGGSWLSNRYCLPLFDSRSRVASNLPVLAHAAESEFNDSDYLRLPGSNLFIEADALR